MTQTQKPLSRISLRELHQRKTPVIKRAESSDPPRLSPLGRIAVGAGVVVLAAVLFLAFITYEAPTGKATPVQIPVNLLFGIAIGGILASVVCVVAALNAAVEEAYERMYAYIGLGVLFLLGSTFIQPIVDILTFALTTPTGMIF